MISSKESYLPRPWLETVPGPPAPSASWWILSGSSSSPSTQSSTSSGAFRGADGEGRGPLKGRTQDGNNGTLCKAERNCRHTFLRFGGGRGEGRLCGGGHGREFKLEIRNLQIRGHQLPVGLNISSATHGDEHHHPQ
jgi:hypothetical protein